MALVGETACGRDTGRCLPALQQPAGQQQAVLHQIDVRGGPVRGAEGAGELEPVGGAGGPGERIRPDTVRRRVMQPLAGTPSDSLVVRTRRFGVEMASGTAKMRTQQTHDRIKRGVNQQAIQAANVRCVSA